MKEDGSATPENLKRMNAVFEKALSLAPSDADLVAKVADFYVLSRQVKEAIPLYLKVISLKGNGSNGSSAAINPLTWIERLRRLL